VLRSLLQKQDDALHLQYTHGGMRSRGGGQQWSCVRCRALVELILERTSRVIRRRHQRPVVLDTGLNRSTGQRRTHEVSIWWHYDRAVFYPLPRDALQSGLLRLHVVRPPVCLWRWWIGIT